MKIYKYVTVLLAVMAMSATFFSCDRDNDITGEPMADHTQGNKQDYWIDFQLTNPGSLSPAAQARFVELKDTVVYGEKLIKVIEHPIYETLEYVTDNFNRVANLPVEENDIVQKVMKPTAAYDGIVDKSGIIKKDFVVTMVLSKDSMRTVLATKDWPAAEVLN
ncbi:MAG: hypothetical protein IJQ49_03015 [Prevotella sp.]|nr:hypothetical protein [Prevotella sp.]